MYKIIKRKYDREKVLLYIFSVILFCVFNPINGQKISNQLDSIHKLDLRNEDKIELYNQLLENYEKEQAYTQLGSDAHQIAKWLHKEADKKREAITVLKKAIDARIKAKPFDPELLRSSYNNLGLYNRRSENYRTAITAYKKLLAVPGSTYLDGRAYIRIGDCYKLLGDPYEAIKNHNEAFTHLQDNKRYLITNHINIASAFKIIRNDKNALKAIAHLKIADSLIHSLPKIRKQSLYVVYNNLGGWYFEILQDSLKGETYFKKALIQAKELGVDEYVSKTSYNLGLTNLKRNNDNALTYFNQSLSYANNDVSITRITYFGLGLLENSLGNYKDATDLYYKSLSAFFNSSITEQNIEKVLSKKELSVTNDKMLLLEILKTAIDNYIDQGIHEKEVKYHYEAIKLVKISDILIDIMLEDNISYDSKLLWRSIASGTYASGISACNEANEIDYGFYLSEKNKALLLIQEIKNGDQKIPSKHIDQKSNLEQEITTLQQQYTANSIIKTKDSIYRLLYNKKEELKQFKDSLSKLYPGYFTDKSIPKILPLSEITYDEDQIILQFMMTERIGGLFPNTYCLILSKGLQKLIKLENTKSLHDKIYALRKQLKAPFRNEEDITSYNEKSYNLYTSLIPEEIRPLLKSKKITIIPDHLIATIPFEALVIDPKLGKYLLEDAEINYTYSLSFQKQNTNRERFAKKEFLGIAPRDFSNNLTSLKNSTKEVEKANSYYSGLLLLDKEATKDNFIKEIGDYKIIHLATHAFATDSITPWIAFKDQKMVNPEIDLLKNNAEMVVLSACNTSLGEVHSGEGVLSLARGFFKSGANTVIPSLWSTNDKATATITSDFYKNLSEGQTKSAALRAAKLSYLRSNTDAEASPHYWAPLIVMGDTGTLLPQYNNLLFLWIGLGFVLVFLFFYSLFLYQKKVKF